MNPQTIEFTSPSTVAESCTTPWHTPSKGTYQDLILKPEVASRRYTSAMLRSSHCGGATGWINSLSLNLSFYPHIAHHTHPMHHS
ncbi:MAG: hypothetical protein WCP35_00660 [Verrucomicrobiota bacterium]